MTTVMIIDPDADHTQDLAGLLEVSGFSTHVVDRGDVALSAFHAVQPDLVLLELSLPGLPGLDVCRELQAVTSVPIVVVTSRVDEVDKVVALELGAADYVTKPYSRAELVARVRAALRRSLPHGPVDQAALRVGSLSLDPANQEAVIHGRAVPLPHREFEVLELLARNAGRVVPRGRLLELWAQGPARTSNTLEVHIKRLRGRIEDDPSHPRHLLTVRGLGYRLNP